MTRLYVCVRVRVRNSIINSTYNASLSACVLRPFNAAIEQPPNIAPS